MLDSITNEIKSAQAGDKDAMARLVEDNQGLIWSIVKRFTGRGYDIEDIYQIGATYAVPYMLGEKKRF